MLMLHMQTIGIEFFLRPIELPVLQSKIQHFRGFQAAFEKDFKIIQELYSRCRSGRGRESAHVQMKEMFHCIPELLVALHRVPEHAFIDIGSVGNLKHILTLGDLLNRSATPAIA